MHYVEIVREDLNHSQTLLFHSTLLWRGLKILASNTLAANTFDKAFIAGAGTGVSLTRSYEYALKHKGSQRQKIIFVLKDISTKPVDYWNKGTSYRTEAEEWFNGSIDLRKHLVSINSPLSIDDFRKQIISDMEEMDFESLRLMVGDEENDIRAWLNSGYKEDIQYWNKWKPVVGIS